jgi:hypothetical protein
MMIYAESISEFDYFNIELEWPESLRHDLNLRISTRGLQLSPGRITTLAKQKLHASPEKRSSNPRPRYLSSYCGQLC